MRRPWCGGLLLVWLSLSLPACAIGAVTVGHGPRGEESIVSFEQQQQQAPTTGDVPDASPQNANTLFEATLVPSASVPKPLDLPVAAWWQAQERDVTRRAMVAVTQLACFALEEPKLCGANPSHFVHLSAGNGGVPAHPACGEWTDAASPYEADEEPSLCGMIELSVMNSSHKILLTPEGLSVTSPNRVQKPLAELAHQLPPYAAKGLYEGSPGEPLLMNSIAKLDKFSGLLEALGGLASSDTPLEFPLDEDTHASKSLHLEEGSVADWLKSVHEAAHGASTMDIPSAAAMRVGMGGGGGLGLQLKCGEEVLLSVGGGGGGGYRADVTCCGQDHKSEAEPQAARFSGARGSGAGLQTYVRDDLSVAPDHDVVANIGGGGGCALRVNLTSENASDGNGSGVGRQKWVMRTKHVGGCQFDTEKDGREPQTRIPAPSWGALRAAVRSCRSSGQQLWIHGGGSVGGGATVHARTCVDDVPGAPGGEVTEDRAEAKEEAHIRGQMASDFWETGRGSIHDDGTQAAFMQLMKDMDAMFQEKRRAKQAEKEASMSAEELAAQQVQEEAVARRKALHPDCADAGPILYGYDLEFKFQFRLDLKAFAARWLPKQ